MKKNILITGATSGIGYETAKILATVNANILLIGKNVLNVKKIVSEFQGISFNNSIKGYCSDLSNQDEIRKVIQKIRCEYEHIDVVIHNAGSVSSQLILTKDNIELQFAVNHLAPFLLTHYLLPLLKKSKQGRIINVSSRAHSRGTIHFNDLFLEKAYNISKAYNQSKLANVMFTYYLSEKLSNTNITVNTFHPGLVNTDFGNKRVNIIHSLLWNIIKQFGRTPEEAANDAIFLAMDENLDNVSGKYFHNRKTLSSSKESYDTFKQKKLWEASLKLTNLKDEEYGMAY